MRASGRHIQLHVHDQRLDTADLVLIDADLRLNFQTGDEDPGHDGAHALAHDDVQARC